MVKYIFNSEKHEIHLHTAQYSTLPGGRGRGWVGHLSSRQLPAESRGSAISLCTINKIVRS